MQMPTMFQLPSIFKGAQCRSAQVDSCSFRLMGNIQSLAVLSQLQVVQLKLLLRS